MPWQTYRLSFRLMSPVRAGARQVGNLLETHPYISGRILWGALTARYTRDKGQGNTPGAYQSVGEKLQNGLRFGYLWPSVDGQTPFYRWENPTLFDYLFLDSTISTAHESSVQSAQEGSLHETEFIAPATRQAEPVWLVGLLWVSSTCELSDWIASLANVQVGGDRHYGWGRGKLECLGLSSAESKIQDPEQFPWTGWVPAHVMATQASASQLSGVLEPLIGWQTSQTGRKVLNPEPGIAHAPGSFCEGTHDFKIGRDGVWEFLE